MSDIGGKLMSCSNPLNLAFKKSEQKSIRGVYGGFAPVAKQNPNLHEVMCTGALPPCGAKWGFLSPRGEQKSIRGVYGGFAPVLDVHIFYLQYRMFFIYSIEWRTAIFVHSV